MGMTVTDRYRSGWSEITLAELTALWVGISGFCILLAYNSAWVENVQVHPTTGAACDLVCNPAKPQDLALPNLSCCATPSRSCFRCLSDRSFDHKDGGMEGSTGVHELFE